MRPRELGVRIGWQALRVALVWTVPLAAFVATGLFNGTYSPTTLVPALVRNFFSNGFSEEFLFRGALMSRLNFVMSEPWALFAQAALFALWHYGADMRGARGDLTTALGGMVIHQMLFAYAMGFVVMRTGSIIGVSVFHALFDANPFVTVPR